MKTYYWETETPHSTNSVTMQDWLENHNTSLDIQMVDGSYAEGEDEHGVVWEIHASGDGDFTHHQVEFKGI
jgi:hypothetical protein